MPRYDVPAGRGRALVVRQGGPARACTTATARRSPPHVQERAEFEIEVIADKGYPGYFLVVADFVQWSKDNGIRVGPGRGSGRRLDGRVRDGHHGPRPDRPPAVL